MGGEALENYVLAYLENSAALAGRVDELQSRTQRNEGTGIGLETLHPTRRQHPTDPLLHVDEVDRLSEEFRLLKQEFRGTGNYIEKFSKAWQARTENLEASVQAMSVKVDDLRLWKGRFDGKGEVPQATDGKCPEAAQAPRQA